MCCKSKPKPAGTTTATTLKANPVVAQSNISSSSRIPKSTVLFSANDYDQKPLTNQSNFVYTMKLKEGDADRGDRLEDYAVEVNKANVSRLLQPK